MDFLKMMKQAKQMQEQMGSLQEEISSVAVEGTAGGGMVTLTMTGKGELKSIRIEVEILEDLILAAHQDAKAKAEALLQQKTQELMGGLGLPAGFKLPF